MPRQGSRAPQSYTSATRRWLDAGPVVNSVNVGRSGLSSGGLRHLVNNVNNVNMCNSGHTGVAPEANYPGPTAIKAQDNLTCTSPEPGATYSHASIINKLGEVACLESRQNLIDANTAHAAPITETACIPEHDDNTVPSLDHQGRDEPEPQLREASA